MTVLPDWQVYSDDELARAVAAGDRQAFSAIHVRHANRLHGFCVAMLRNRDATASSAPLENPLTTTAVVPTLDNPRSLPASPPLVVVSPPVVVSPRVVPWQLVPMTPSQGGGQQHGGGQQQGGGQHQQPVGKHMTTLTRQDFFPATDACEQRSSKRVRFCATGRFYYREPTPFKGVVMDAKIIGSVMPVLEVALNRGETLIAESGEPSWMTESIQLRTSTRMDCATGISGLSNGWPPAAAS